MPLFSFRRSPRQQEEVTVSEEVTENDEPPEDIDHDDDHEDFLLSYELISEEEVARLQHLCSSSSSQEMESAPISTATSWISSKGSSSSLGSTGTAGPSSVIKGPSSYHNKKQEKGKSATSLQQQPQKRRPQPPELTEEELQTATNRIWYLIQLKGYYNHQIEEDDHDEYYYYHGTKGGSPSRQQTTSGWFSNLLRLHERMRQQAADKKRFNVNNIPQETREQLKHLYVY